MSPTDALIARLRELSLATSAAVGGNLAPDDRQELLSAFADDVASALQQAKLHADRLMAQLSGSPGPWAFLRVSTELRQAHRVERSAGWTAGLREGAEIAHELARLYAAAAPLVEVLNDSESART